MKQIIIINEKVRRPCTKSMVDQLELYSLLQQENDGNFNYPRSQTVIVNKSSTRFPSTSERTK
ncbi:hypothetical protein RvY_09742 [Ramazzottius varieornatus]|uniref:Uncharacterized protein n=1 Tax=Ramazzottius varieornatus TaxID=947166 RepID=A0A1D1VJE5_RAMVA|nr:hypothetical protein RvY_09742 [Ramazzottius varieornatus]